MKLQIVHRTHYDYASPVSESFNEVRLQPVTHAGQVCLQFLLKVLPATRLRHYRDFYFNWVQYFEVPEAHAALTVEATSLVDTAPPPAGLADVAFPVARLGECLRIESCHDFLQMSLGVSLDVAVWKLAQDAAGGEADAWQAALAIMRFIHREFAYEAGATTVATHMLEVVAARRGVCQDFAHVMLGMCRTLKLPARYVSGYLYNGPAGQLKGAQASHAWVEVFIPGHGWLALDPTNNQPADDRYVKLAVGRDYADAAPVRGSFKGAAEQRLAVALEIMRVD
jgi:transglutaminase-like putative cysteine protease